MIQGTGIGQGYPRNWTGGFTYCKCPYCGYILAHRKGIPCNSIKCPRCGTSMVGY